MLLELCDIGFPTGDNDETDCLEEVDESLVIVPTHVSEPLMESQERFGLEYRDGREFIVVVSDIMWLGKCAVVSEANCHKQMGIKILSRQVIVRTSKTRWIPFILPKHIFEYFVKPI